MEKWKSYIEGHYEVSDAGNVRSIDKTVLFKGTPGLRRGIQLKPTVNSKGYLTVVICVDGSRKTEYVHRIVAKVFIENPEKKETVNHKDGNVLNNAATNLEWNTSAENFEHAQANGLISAGNTKLKEQEVIEIKQLIVNGLSNPEIAKMYGVDKATIRQIRINKNWTHVAWPVESHT